LPAREIGPIFLVVSRRDTETFLRPFWKRICVAEVGAAGFGRLSFYMAKNGRRAKATAAQRAEVERLAEAGHSVRAIAAEVFGEARFRGRVERILRQPPPGTAETAHVCARIDGVAGRALNLAGLSPAAQLRLLYDWRMAELSERGEAPSMSELRAMFDVLQRLQALEEFERLRARRRQGGGSNQ
jgi:hypothetical protein